MSVKPSCRQGRSCQRVPGLLSTGDVAHAGSHFHGGTQVTMRHLSWPTQTSWLHCP